MGSSQNASRVLWIVLALPLLAGCTSWRAAQLYQSGTAELDRGEYELAIEDLERASELAPQASQVQNHLGLALAAAGREDEARAAMRRAVALDCTNDAAAHNLALLEAPLGKQRGDRVAEAPASAASSNQVEGRAGGRELVSIDTIERESQRNMMEPNP